MVSLGRFIAEQIIRSGRTSHQRNVAMPTIKMAHEGFPQSTIASAGHEPSAALMAGMGKLRWMTRQRTE
jgi:hypothetical protein